MVPTGPHGRGVGKGLGQLSYTGRFSPTFAERAYRRHEKEHTASLADPGPASSAKENLAGARVLTGDTEEFRTLVTDTVARAGDDRAGLAGPGSRQSPRCLRLPP